MDKFNLVLDIIEHPENYTPEQLEEFLSDPETREIYNLLCKSESAIDANREIDVNAEWKAFADRRIRRPHHFFLWPGNRAASIAAVILTSLVAVAAGIAVTVNVIEHTRETEAVSQTGNISSAVPTDEPEIQTDDTVTIISEPVMFENQSLDEIMNKIASAYGVQVKFNNKEAATLHLYYKFDPQLSLDEVISQLNTFEQINITRNGSALSID